MRILGVYIESSSPYFRKLPIGGVACQLSQLSPERKFQGRCVGWPQRLWRMCLEVHGQLLCVRERGSFEFCVWLLSLGFRVLG